MGVQYDHVLGHLRRFGLIPEVTPGTYLPPTTADFLKVKTCSIPFKNPRSERDDSGEGLDPYEMITEKQEVPVSFETYVFSSGVLGAATEPVLGRLFQGVMGGTPVRDAGVSWTYALSNTQTIPSYSLVQNFNANSSIYQDQVRGFILDELKINAPGNEKSTITCSGKAMGHVGVGYGVSSAITGAGTGVTFTTPTGFNFEAGGVVQIDAQTNGGAGFTVASSTATGIVVAPAHAGGIVVGSIVRPYVPTPTYQAGTVISHIQGALTLDGVAFLATGLELSIKRNLDWIEDEYAVPALSDAAPKMRTIEGSVSVRARRDNIIELIRRKNFTQRNLNFQLGATAGNIWELQMATIEPLVEGLEGPQSGMGTIKFPFRALAPTNGSLAALVAVAR